MKPSMTTFDKTATVQKCVTLDLIRTINEVLISPVAITPMAYADSPITSCMSKAQKQVLDSLGALIAAKAYLWMVSHAEDYIDIMTSRNGTVTLTNPDLTHAGYSVVLSVDGEIVNIKVVGRDNALLFSGQCDLGHSL